MISTMTTKTKNARTTPIRIKALFQELDSPVLSNSTAAVPFGRTLAGTVGGRTRPVGLAIGDGLIQ